MAPGLLLETSVTNSYNYNIELDFSGIFVMSMSFVATDEHFCRKHFCFFTSVIYLTTNATHKVHPLIISAHHGSDITLMSFSAAHLSHLFSNLLKQIPCCTAGRAEGTFPVTLAT